MIIVFLTIFDLSAKQLNNKNKGSFDIKFIRKFLYSCLLYVMMRKTWKNEMEK